MSLAPGSRDSSPDIITLPSSPIVPHSAKKRKSSPLKTRSTNARVSPSKSFLLEPLSTRKGAESPWRVKVTVEASPGPKAATRRTTPARRARASEARDVSTDLRQPRRKRKATEEPAAPSTQALEDDLALDNQSMGPPTFIPSPSRARRMAARKSLTLRPSARKRLPETHSIEVEDNTVTENEDFSMVSMESLQSAKEASYISLGRSQGLQPIPEKGQQQDNSVASVSYLPSSPPAHENAASIAYPVISEHELDAQQGDGRTKQYDMMSWRPTGAPVTFVRSRTSASPATSSRAKAAAHDQHSPTARSTKDAEAEIGYSRRDSAQLDHHSLVRNDSQPEDANDDSEDEAGPDILGNDENDGEEDIWQEEASRSLRSEQNDTQHPENDVISTNGGRDPSASSHDINELFADEPLKPPRAKIPRTWRRSSGINLSYVDSPGYGLNQHHDVEVNEQAPADSTKETEESGDRRRMPTPPSTDEEVRQAAETMEPSSEISQPDAEATRFHSDLEIIAEHDGAPQDIDGEAGQDGRESTSEEIDTNHNETSAGDGTGLFFKGGSRASVGRERTPLLAEQPRRRPRPQRRETANLTELLNLDLLSPAKQAAAPATAKPSPAKHINDSLVQRMEQRRRYGRPVELPSIEGIITLDTSDRSAIDTHRHRSPQKVPEVVDKLAATAAPGGTKRRYGRTRPRAEASIETSASQLRPSRATTRAQTQGDDMPAQKKIKSSHESLEHDRLNEVSATTSQSFETQETTGISTSFRSYEERLNRDSPAKIKVNFNDSSSALNLSPKKYTRPPLFDRGTIAPRVPVNKGSLQKPIQQQKPYEAQKESIVEPSLFKRISSSFWSAIAKASEAKSAALQSRPSSVKSALAQESQVETSLLEGTFPSTRRTALRARYGVLSATFPWRLYHMRTLHRMHNSLFSGRADTLIPSSGPLPSTLACLVGTQQTSINGHVYRFTREHAYVVQAFLSLFVPAHVVEGMQTGEVDALGDRLSSELRSNAAKGDEILRRDGMHDPVWRVRADGKGPGMWVEKLSGEIDVQFVVRALGDVHAEELRAKKHTAPQERR